MVKSFRNMFFGSEGFFLSEVKGPGEIWLQTMPAQILAKSSNLFLPTNRSN